VVPTRLIANGRMRIDALGTVECGIPSWSPQVASMITISIIDDTLELK